MIILITDPLGSASVALQKLVDSILGYAVLLAAVATVTMALLAMDGHRRDPAATSDADPQSSADAPFRLLGLVDERRVAGEGGAGNPDLPADRTADRASDRYASDARPRRRTAAGRAATAHRFVTNCLNAAAAGGELSCPR
ncbi:MAG TPA: hypothetical protein VN605_01300 [Thermoanaerobaculia bacterium]|nr:hypothetical protein [Thermoanaerobaculia bacterium]